MKYSILITASIAAAVFVDAACADDGPRYCLDKVEHDRLSSPFLSRPAGQAFRSRDRLRLRSADRLRYLDRMSSGYLDFYRFGIRRPGYYAPSVYEYGGYAYGGPWYLPGSSTNTRLRSHIRWQSSGW